MGNFNDIIAEERPTLVDFFATWCGPCKMQVPILDAVKNRIGDKANIVKIDVDKNEELAARYRVQSVPTLMIFKSGEIVWRAAGVQQADFLEAKIREFITPE